MRLSWYEIRARAAAFATEWRGAHYERGQTQTFYNEFFEIFGTPRKRVAVFEEPVASRRHCERAKRKRSNPEPNPTTRTGGPG